VARYEYNAVDDYGRKARGTLSSGDMNGLRDTLAATGLHLVSARQVAEISRRLNAVETRVESNANRARGAVDPIAAEIDELGSLVRQIADSVAAHETALQGQGALPARPAPGSDAADAPLALSESDALTGARRFRGLSREGILRLSPQYASN